MERRCSSLFRRSALSCLSVLGLSAMSCTIEPGGGDSPKLGVDQGAETQGATTDPLRNSGEPTTGAETEGAASSSGGTEVPVDSDTGTLSTQPDSAGQSTSPSGTQTQTVDTTGTLTGTLTNQSSTDTGVLTSGGTTMSTSSDTTTECPSAQVSFTAVVPSIYILVDQSGSMNTSMDNGDPNTPNLSRWNTVKQALVAQAASGVSAGVVRQMQDKAKFAMSAFTSQDENECPRVSWATSGNPATRSPKLNNLPAIEAFYADSNNTPNGYTPSAESVYEVWQEIKNDNSSNRILVFASDGDPTYPGWGDRCAMTPLPDSLKNSNSQKRVVDVVRAMKQDNISTFVISVGDGGSVTHLDEVAKAGVGALAGQQESDPAFPDNPRPNKNKSDDYFFPSNNSQALKQAFASIIFGSRPCSFALDGTVEAGHESEGTLTLMGTQRTYGDPNGWRVIDNGKKIELLGTSCTDLRSQANVQLNVEFSCEAFVPG